jgi:phosphoribosylamine--glycine ligase
LGDTVTAAQQAAYQLADSISWDELYCRRDIAYRAVAREKETDA